MKTAWTRARRNEDDQPVSRTEKAVGQERPQPRVHRLYIPGADDETLKIARLRFWNYPEIAIGTEEAENALCVRLEKSLAGVESEKPELFKSQGYCLDIGADVVKIRYEGRAGLINAITSVKMLLQAQEGGFALPQCEIVDYPSLAVRAVAPTFSWYAAMAASASTASCGALKNGSSS